MLDPLFQSALVTAFQQVTFALVAACVLVLTTLIGILAQRGTAFLKVKLWRATHANDPRAKASRRSFKEWRATGGVDPRARTTQ